MCRLPYPRLSLRWLLIFLASWALGAVLGCDLPSSALHSLFLDRDPTAADWSAAVPLVVEAVGGRTSASGEGDVDRDAVHKATASCHHGTQASPVRVEVRSFYTVERLFLRFEWVDPTPQEGPTWRWDGARWVAGGLAQDGLGVLWGGDPASFSCTRACHLEDWRMAGPRAFADYRMAAPAGAGPLDFWVWRAGRGGLAGAVEDGRLTVEGREGDAPGDFVAPNSVRARDELGDVFGAGDRPWEAPAPEPGARAPGYRVVDPSPGRREVECRVERGRGTWRLTLSRRRSGSDPGDVRFDPGGELAFGLALLDGVEKDHTAVPAPIRLILVDPSALPGRRSKE